MLREWLTRLRSELDIPADAPIYERIGLVAMQAFGSVRHDGIAFVLQLTALLMLGGYWAWTLCNQDLYLPIGTRLGLIWLGLTFLPLIAGSFPQREEDKLWDKSRPGRSQKFAVWLEKAFGIYVGAFLGQIATSVLWLLLTYVGLWSRVSVGVQVTVLGMMLIVTCSLSFVGSVIAVRNLGNLVQSGQPPCLHWRNILLGVGFPLILYPGLIFLGASTASIWSQWYLGGPIIGLSVLGLAWMLRREPKRLDPHSEPSDFSLIGRGPSAADLPEPVIDGRSDGRTHDVDEHVFLSYAHSDRGFVQPLAKALRDRGISVWIDESYIAPGAAWARTIETAIEGCTHLLLVLSPDSVDSAHVRDELSYALGEGKVIVPLLYQECKLPLRVQRFHYIHWAGRRPDDKQALDELVAVLTREA